jgi:hypothetical protein
MLSRTSRVLISSSWLSLACFGCGGAEPGGAATNAEQNELDTASTPFALRLVAPLSGSLSGARRPRFHVVGAPVALIQVCADRACTHPLQDLLAIGGAGRPLLPLPTGVVFWRGRAPAGNPHAPWTAAWELFVPPGGDAPDATRGLRYDADADGFVDAAVRDQNEEVATDFLNVYRGGAGGLDPASDTVLPLDTSHFGNAVATLGDVNGDGFGDLALADGRGVVVYAGSATGVVPTPLVVIPVVAGVQPFDFGREVAAAGDVNGDGYGDLVVSDNFFRIWLYLGSATGPSLTPAWTLDRTNSGRFAGILTAADLDGDGFGDLVIRDYGPTGTTQSFRVFHGSAAGLESADAGTQVVRPSLPFGSAGDVNGDGIADLVTAETTADFSAGTLAFFPGGPGFPPAQPAETVAAPQRPGIQIGDFNGDGLFDVAATTSVQTSSFFFTDDRVDVYPGTAAGISPAPQVTIRETDVLPDNTLNFGATLSNGDYNRDGVEDLLAGASAPFPTPFFDSSAGQALVFPGSATGLQTTPALRITGGPGFASWVTSAAPELP